MKNLPAALLDELQSVAGFDRESFIAAHELLPVTSVRLNPARDTRLFYGNKNVLWCPGAVYLASRPVFTLDPAYHAGAYYVQEASSMFLHRLFRSIQEDRKGLRVLDLCAAPGGKSTLIAAMLDKDSLLVSNDVIRTRATILDENITRWGQMNTWVTSNDPRDFGRMQGYFDVIIVDAPCSGSGLFRKDTNALSAWSEANVQLCAERQQRILADVWPALKQDGFLIYATCSYSPQENEQILDWMDENYEVSPVTQDIPDEWGITVAQTGRGMTGYRFFPDKVNGEGFFISVIQKKEFSGSVQEPRFRTANDKKIQQQAGHLLAGSDVLFIQTGKEEYSALAHAHEADWRLMQQFVYFRKTGLRLGVPAGKDWLPAHDVALSIDADPQLKGVEASREQALLFLKREEMGIEAIEKGWQLIRYQGMGLGWIKSLGNRINNYLPKHWRIRMDIPDTE